MNCGKAFQFQPSNSAGKFCSFECMKAFRYRTSEANGLAFRKLVMRAGLHHDDTMLRVWAKLRRAPRQERYAVLYDLTLEHRQVRAEVQRIYDHLDRRTRTGLRKTMHDLDIRLRREMNIHPERWGKPNSTKPTKPIRHDRRIRCQACKSLNSSKAGLCYSCGALIST